MLPRPPRSPLFPYTTLFRSGAAGCLPVSPARMRFRSAGPGGAAPRSEEHTSELQSRFDLVCRLLLEKKNEYIFTFYVPHRHVYRAQWLNFMHLVINPTPLPT